MQRILLLTIILLLASSTSAFASFYSSGYDARGTVVASVEIEGKGIYNLVVSIQFLNKPFDKRDYTSDEYEELIKRLAVEWRGIALKTVFESNKYKITDLPALKAKVDTEIQKLIKLSKKKHGVKESIEVVYSISSFYLLEPSSK